MQEDEVELVESSSGAVVEGNVGSKQKFGRPSSVAWDHFKRGDYCPRTKRRKGTCLHCTECLDGRATNLETHILQDCKKISNEARQNFRKRLAESLPEAAEISRVSAADRKRARMINQKGPSQLTIAGHIWKKEYTSDKEAQQLDQAMLQFFVLCNVSFVTASSPWFLNFIQKLNPFYVPPGVDYNNVSFHVSVLCSVSDVEGLLVHGAGPQKLSGTLLSEEAQRIQASFLLSLDSCKYITLSLDGWTDISNKSIYAICLMLDDELQSPHLLNVIDLSSERHTAACILGKEFSSERHLAAFVLGSLNPFKILRGIIKIQ